MSHRVGGLPLMWSELTVWEVLVVPQMSDSLHTSVSLGKKRCKNDFKPNGKHVMLMESGNLWNSGSHALIKGRLHITVV
jgi:hypothetical protein